MELVREYKRQGGIERNQDARIVALTGENLKEAGLEALEGLKNLPEAIGYLLSHPEEIKKLPAQAYQDIKQAINDYYGDLNDIRAGMLKSDPVSIEAQAKAEARIAAGLIQVVVGAGGGTILAKGGLTVAKTTVKVLDPRPGLHKMPRVEMSANGNISAQKITEHGIPMQHKLSREELEIQKKLGNAQATAERGQLGEDLSHSYFYRNGFESLPGKCGSGNCFDGVYIKDGQMYVVEVKPLNPDGTIKLSGPDPITGLQTQMSDQWIVDVIGRLKKSTDQASRSTAIAFEKYTDAGGKISKIVVGVNSSDVQLVVLK